MTETTNRSEQYLNQMIADEKPFNRQDAAATIPQQLRTPFKINGVSPPHQQVAPAKNPPCEFVLTAQKRKGQLCGNDGYQQTRLCKRHYDKSIKAAGQIQQQPLQPPVNNPSSIPVIQSSPLKKQIAPIPLNGDNNPPFKEYDEKGQEVIVFTLPKYEGKIENKAPPGEKKPQYTGPAVLEKDVEDMIEDEYRRHPFLLHGMPRENRGEMDGERWLKQLRAYREDKATDDAMVFIMNGVNMWVEKVAAPRIGYDLEGFADYMNDPLFLSKLNEVRREELPDMVIPAKYQLIGMYLMGIRNLNKANQARKNGNPSNPGTLSSSMPKPPHQE